MRSGRLTQLRALAESLNIEPELVLQAWAITLLRPDLDDRLRAGDLSIEDAQPAAYKAFIDLLRADVRLPSMAQ